MSNQNNHPEAIISLLVAAGDTHSEALTSTSVSAFELQALGRAYQQSPDESPVAADPTRSHHRDLDARWISRGDSPTFHAYLGYVLVAKVQRQGTDW